MSNSNENTPVEESIKEDEKTVGDVCYLPASDALSLWQDLPSDEADPYFKPDQDSQTITDELIKWVAASKRGRSHAHVGGFRDDDFHMAVLQGGWSILIVADGAGSAQYSRKGSAIAVRRTADTLRDYLASERCQLLEAEIAAWQSSKSDKERALKERLYYLFGESAKSALKGISEEAEGKEATIRDYATTLLVAIVKEMGSEIFVSAFCIGDGVAAVYLGNENVKLLSSPDSGEFAGQTRFLDARIMGNAQEIWSRIFFDIFPASATVTLMTDGVSDPFFETDKDLGNGLLWKGLFEKIGKSLGEDEPDVVLLKWMDFHVPGHHDDRTIALRYKPPVSNRLDDGGVQ